MEQSWNSIDSSWLKIETGYQIAKQLSAIPIKSMAKDFIKRTELLKRKQWLASASCISAYKTSLSLFARTVGLLIRANRCTQDDLDQFGKYLSYLDSTSDSLAFWSKIALEYYSIDKDKFKNIVNKHIVQDISLLSTYSQKKVLFNVAPALYLNGASQFFEIISSYDVAFIDSCFDNIARFVLSKYPYIERTNIDLEQLYISLDYEDYENLVTLIEKSSNESFIFDYIHLITKNIGSLIPIQKTHFIKRLKDVAKNHLPMENGIRHKGYQIACLAAIARVDEEDVRFWDDIQKDIEEINNASDQSLLYTLLIPYAKRPDLKISFIEKSINKAKEIHCDFDKINRIFECLSSTIQCYDKKAKSVAKEARQCLLSSKSGTFNESQKLIDIIREYDEDLANETIDALAQDPIQQKYQQRLKKHIASKKRIESAKKDYLEVLKLSSEEQTIFFDQQLETIIKKRKGSNDIRQMEPVIKSIYSRPITETSSASLFFLETIYEKIQNYSISNKAEAKGYANLLRVVYDDLYYTLKYILSLSSGTKERLEKISSMINTISEYPEDRTNIEKNSKLIEQWFLSHPYNQLRIIDSSFCCKDILYLKPFIDRDIKITVLIHDNHGESKPLFQKEWNSIFSISRTNIKIVSVCKELSSLSPFEQRSWVLFNPSTRDIVGINVCIHDGSMQIAEMNKEELDAWKEMWTDFAQDEITIFNGDSIKYYKLL